LRRKPEIIERIIEKITPIDKIVEMPVIVEKPIVHEI